MLVAQREYSYDTLGRPTARNTARQGTVVNDIFEHNTRSELVIATVNGKNYEYAYDNIGNREFSLEDGKATMYDANSLNQYTSIAVNGGTPFIPQFDSDGNQTLIKTETGIWSAVYNAENRPVCFTNTESNTVVECQYDSMGRRAFKKVTVNGSITLHQRYIYRGYLQIACSDLTRSHHPDLSYILWDPTQPVATRPLAIQINGTWYTYGWDLTKNICELYSTAGAIATSYTYTPFGQVTSTGNVEQPIQWSSEVWDSELGLVYYNWRYYNVLCGVWCECDTIFDKNMYLFIKNAPIYMYDLLGEWGCQQRAKDTCNPDYNPDMWNSPTYISTSNCYLYALDRPSTDKDKTYDPGFSTDKKALARFIWENSSFSEAMEYIKSPRAKDEKIGVSVNAASYCREITRLAKSEGVITTQNNSCRYGYYRIYLVVEEKSELSMDYAKYNRYVDPPDYHWFREDSNTRFMNLSSEKLWSHKPGRTEVGEQITLKDVLNQNSIFRKFNHVEYNGKKKIWIRTYNYNFDCGFLCAPCRS